MISMHAISHIYTCKVHRLSADHFLSVSVSSSVQSTVTSYRCMCWSLVQWGVCSYLSDSVAITSCRIAARRVESLVVVSRDERPTTAIRSSLYCVDDETGARWRCRQTGALRSTHTSMAWSRHVYITNASPNGDQTSANRPLLPLKDSKLTLLQSRFGTRLKYQNNDAAESGKQPLPTTFLKVTWLSEYYNAVPPLFRSKWKL